MTKQEKTEYMKTHAAECIFQYLGNNKQTRKNILDNATNQFNKTYDKNIKNIKNNETRSYVGTVLNELISEKDLCYENGLIYKTVEDSIIVDKAKCKSKLLEYLQKKDYTKTELYNLIIKSLGADQTKSLKDDNEIKEYIGQLLTRYVNDEVIELENNKYRFIVPTININSKPLLENEFKKQFLDRLHKNGGSFFERFMANVLEKYFTLTGRTVWDCIVNGGSNDAGIDIKIKLSDDLGFVDEVMVQAKCRAKAQVTENEVRNFYGAINVEKASKGIYVTTSTFHQNADKLLHSLDNCVGIDGNGVFELSRKVLYGMKITRNGFIFDDKVFDI